MTDVRRTRTCAVVVVVICLASAVSAFAQAGGGTGTLTGTVVDSTGASVVLGYLKGQVDFGGGFLTSAGAGDIYLVKRASDGSYVWSQRFGSTEDDRPLAIAIDSSGNLVITGYFRGTVSFGGAALTAAPGTANGFLAKYSPKSELLWLKQFGPTINHAGQ